MDAVVLRVPGLAGNIETASRLAARSICWKTSAHALNP